MPDMNFNQVLTDDAVKTVVNALVSTSVSFLGTTIWRL